MTSPMVFHHFPSLPPELRQKIWFLTLPGPRILHVIRSWPASYIATPSSWGAQLPIALLINSESRREALRYLTPVFNCYWNLTIDVLYFEPPPGTNASKAMEQIRDMRIQGLLNDFKNLALDWHSWYISWPEHCTTTLRLLPGLKSCAFVFGTGQEQKDVVNAGVAWRLIPCSHWRDGRAEFAREVEDRIAIDRVANEMEWKERPASLEITWNEISERKAVPMLRILDPWNVHAGLTFD